jgi:RNA polymerase sigma-70 factor (ECF subfamily)
MADGPAAALSLVERLRRSGALDRYHLLHATEADLLRRLERREEAAAAYARALALATNGQERRFLRRRLEETRREG